MTAQPITPQDIRIEIIHEIHDISNFKSYEQELVDFLHDDALENQKQNLSLTFLWFYQENLASYITLLTDRITLEGDLKELFTGKGIYYKSLPALKIGRLCVDDQFLRRGLGKLMVLFSVEKAKEITRDKAGCRFITVDAKGSSADFYRKLGFKTLESGKMVSMYLDLLRFSLP